MGPATVPGRADVVFRPAQKETAVTGKKKRVGRVLDMRSARGPEGSSAQDSRPEVTPFISEEGT